MSKPLKHLIASDNPILKRVADPVRPGENIAAVLELMEKVCKKSKIGVGLAAPQVGVSKRIIFLNCRDAKGVIRGRFLINPRIVATSPETDVESEGCLSFPGIYKRIIRHVWIDVEHQRHDSLVSERLCNYPARVAQHEIDHLDGICKVGDPSFKGEPEEEPRLSSMALIAAVAAASPYR